MEPETLELNQCKIHIYTINKIIGGTALHCTALHCMTLD
jgi:hypothetical protein